MVRMCFEIHQKFSYGLSLSVFSGLIQGYNSAIFAREARKIILENVS